MHIWYRFVLIFIFYSLLIIFMFFVFQIFVFAKLLRNSFYGYMIVFEFTKRLFYIMMYTCFHFGAIIECIPLTILLYSMYVWVGECLFRFTILPCFVNDSSVLSNIFRIFVNEEYFWDFCLLDAKYIHVQWLTLDKIIEMKKKVSHIFINLHFEVYFWSRVFNQ